MMKEKFREFLPILGYLYMAPGIILAVIQIPSVGLWMFWHTWFADPPTIILGGREIVTSVFSTGFSGLFGAAIAPFIWPLGLMQVVNGDISLVQLIFYPWFEK